MPSVLRLIGGLIVKGLNVHIEVMMYILTPEGENTTLSQNVGHQSPSSILPRPSYKKHLSCTTAKTYRLA
jgi:hypothetical protein